MPIFWCNETFVHDIVYLLKEKDMILSKVQVDFINESREDYKRGRTIDHEVLFQRNDSWLSERSNPMDRI